MAQKAGKRTPLASATVDTMIIATKNALVPCSDPLCARSPDSASWDSQDTGGGSSGPWCVVRALLSAYGKPTIDFSVASVVLVSVPDPPSRVSLPLTPSREISASLPLPPLTLSAPPPPVTLSAPPSPRSAVSSPP